jgi:hypothetical protein
MFFTKVGVWVIANLVREAVDESNVDYINGWVHADRGERTLVSSLSPVYSHIVTRREAERCRCGRGQKYGCRSGA